jgi:hypothetical protein
MHRQQYTVCSHKYPSWKCISESGKSVTPPTDAALAVTASVQMHLSKGVAFVTGAAQGTDRAIALRLADDGIRYGGQ